MRRYRELHDGSEIALCNFALTFAKALLVFCVMLFMLITPEAKDGSKPKAEFLITVDWLGKYDVDTWLRLPDGSRVNYQNKESGIAFLERDDLGTSCEQSTSHTCEEVTVLRGIAPGEYVMALHLYSANGSISPATITPVTPVIRIEKLNPSVRLVWQDTVSLDTIRQEKRLVRFRVTETGEMVGFDTEVLPSLVYAR